MLRSALYGTAVVLERFDADARRERLVAEQRVTIASLVGTMLARLLDAGAELGPPSLRAARRRPGRRRR